MVKRHWFHSNNCHSAYCCCCFCTSLFATLLKCGSLCLMPLLLLSATSALCCLSQLLAHTHMYMQDSSYQLHSLCYFAFVCCHCLPLLLFLLPLTLSSLPIFSAACRPAFICSFAVQSAPSAISRQATPCEVDETNENEQVRRSHSNSSIQLCLPYWWLRTWVRFLLSLHHVQPTAYHLIAWLALSHCKAFIIIAARWASKTLRSTRRGRRAKLPIQTSNSDAFTRVRLCVSLLPPDCRWKWYNNVVV